MSTARRMLALFAVLAGIACAQAQAEEPAKPPALPQKEQAERASLKQYGLGLLCLREDRLIEAMRAFEEAVALDPTAVAPQKALIALYAGFDRTAEMLAACKKVLALAPADTATWYLYSKQLRRQGQMAEAKKALQKGIKSLQLDEQLELGQQLYFDLAVLLADARDRKQAAKAYEHCAELVKRSLQRGDLQPLREQEVQAQAGELYERIGKLYLDLENLDAAEQAYRQAQHVYPAGSGRCNWNLAQVSLKRGDTSKALEYLDTYLRFQPPELEPYALKIRLLQKSDKKADVLPWLEQICQKDRHNQELHLLLARQYLEHKRTAQAENLYKQMAEETPAEEVYQGLFHLYQSQEEFGAVRTLRLINETVARTEDANVVASSKAKAQVRAMVGAIRKDKGLARELLEVALPLLRSGTDLEYQMVLMLAVIADQQRQPAQAEAFYRASLKAATPQTEALVYGGLLRVLWQEHKYEDIVAICQAGLRKAAATNHILFHSDLARAFARLNKLAEALQEADQAVKLATETNRLALQGLRIRLLTQAGKLEQAQKEGLALLEKYDQPGDIVDVRYLLSHIYTQAGQLSKAEDQLQLILQVDPTNAVACNDLGYLWADQSKNLVEAENLIRKALELDRQQRSSITNPTTDPAEDNAAYIDSLGWVLFRRGKIQEARAQLERAAKMPEGDDPVIWDHLGDVYYRLEMPEQALQAWQRALTMYEEHNLRPRDQRYRDLRQKVQQGKTAAPDS